MERADENIRVCVVIPTYNNAATVCDVAERSLACVADVIVVNDGSTDDTLRLLDGMSGQITVLSYPDNKGKGHALQTGLDYARSHGFTHAITIDADGQHYPEDIPLFIKAAADGNAGAIILGNRGMEHENMQAKSTFANRFSNFWFAVQTFCRPGDTQTGFRMYPLHRRLRFYTSRYEAELAVLVDARWKGTKVTSIPVRVYYPPVSERVSHFRPVRDFMRISALNTVLCFLAFLYGYPSMVIHSLKDSLRK